MAEVTSPVLYSSKLHQNPYFRWLPGFILLHPIFQPDTNPIGNVAGVVRHQR